MVFAGDPLETVRAKNHGHEDSFIMPDDVGISDELSEKILAYVEREVGRDAPLSPEDEKKVRDHLATDPAAQALADDFRDVDRRLKAMVRAFGNIPWPDELATFIRGYAVLMKEGNVQEADNLLGDFKERRRKG